MIGSPSTLAAWLDRLQADLFREVAHVTHTVVADHVTQMLGEPADDAGPLPPLTWWANTVGGTITELVGQLPAADLPPHAMPAALGRWAVHLSLAPAPAEPGSVEYRGHVSSRVPIAVWAVVDPETYHALPAGPSPAGSSRVAHDGGKP